jgi:hypothetical protein
MSRQPHSNPPSAAVEANAAGNYPSRRFDQRERRLIECLKAYIDAATAAVTPAAGYASTLLGASSSYEVFGETGVTGSAAGNTVNGDMGRTSGGSANGGAFPATISNGSAHDNDASAIAAQAALIAAAATVSARGYSVDRTATQDLANQTLFPGVYKFTATTCSISAGTLTLDANGNPNAQFIFNVGTALTTGASVSVVLVNGARADNVIWNCGSAATLGASNSFKGNIFAGTSITVGANTSVTGRLMAQAAVTLSGPNDILNHAS